VQAFGRRAHLLTATGALLQPAGASQGATWTRHAAVRPNAALPSDYTPLDAVAAEPNLAISPSCTKEKTSPTPFGPQTKGS